MSTNINFNGYLRPTVEDVDTKDRVRLKVPKLSKVLKDADPNTVSKLYIEQFDQMLLGIREKFI